VAQHTLLLLLLLLLNSKCIQQQRSVDRTSNLGKKNIYIKQTSLQQHIYFEHELRGAVSSHAVPAAAAAASAAAATGDPRRSSFRRAFLSTRIAGAVSARSVRTLNR